LTSPVETCSSGTRLLMPRMLQTGKSALTALSCAREKHAMPAFYPK
jgi:hypothetical protein